jgi:hypothetical protein
MGWRSAIDVAADSERLRSFEALDLGLFKTQGSLQTEIQTAGYDVFEQTPLVSDTICDEAEPCMALQVGTGVSFGWPRRIRKKGGEIRLDEKSHFDLTHSGCQEDESRDP